jgi:hypothetical protein
VFSHEFFIAPWLLSISQRFEASCHVYTTFSAQARALVTRATASYCLSVGVFLPLCFTPVPRLLWSKPEAWRPNGPDDPSISPQAYELVDCEFADFTTRWYAQGGVALLTAAVASVIAAPAYALLCEGYGAMKRRSANSFLFCLPICRRCACTCWCGVCVKFGKAYGVGCCETGADAGQLQTIRTQRQLDQLYEAPLFNTPTRYAHVVGNVVVALMYSAGLPLLIPICICAIGSRFWVDKIMLLRRCRDRIRTVCPSTQTLSGKYGGTHLHTDLAAAGCAGELLLCAGGPAALHLLVAIFMLGHSEQDDIQRSSAGEGTATEGIHSPSKSDITGIGLVKHGGWLRSALAAAHYPWWLQRYGHAPLRSNVIVFPFIALSLFLFAVWVQCRWCGWWFWCRRSQARKKEAAVLFDAALDKEQTSEQQAQQEHEEHGDGYQESHKDSVPSNSDDEEGGLKIPPTVRSWSALVAQEFDKGKGRSHPRRQDVSSNRSADLYGRGVDRRGMDRRGMDSMYGRGMDRSEVSSSDSLDHSRGRDRRCSAASEEGSLRSSQHSMRSRTDSAACEAVRRGGRADASSFDDGSMYSSSSVPSSGASQSVHQHDAPRDGRPHNRRVAGYSLLQLGASLGWRAQSSDPALELLFERPGAGERYGGESFASALSRSGAYARA